MFLLINQVLSFVFGHLKVRRELDRVSRTGFLAVAAENAARKVDAKELGIASSVVVFGCLQRDTVDWTSDGAQVTRDAALATIRVTREDDAATPARGQVRFLFRIENCHASPEHVQED